MLVKQEIVLCKSGNEVSEILRSFAGEMGYSVSNAGGATVITAGSKLSLNPNTVRYKITVKEEPRPEGADGKAAIAIGASMPFWMAPRYRQILNHRLNQLLNRLWEKKALKEPVDFPKGPVVKYPFAAGSVFTKMPDMAFNLLYNIIAFFLTLAGAALAMWILGMMLYHCLLADVAEQKKFLDIPVDPAGPVFARMVSAEYYAATGVFFAIFGSIYTGTIAFIINLFCSIIEPVNRLTWFLQAAMSAALFFWILPSVPAAIGLVSSILFAVFTYAGFSATWGLKKDFLRL